MLSSGSKPSLTKTPPKEDRYAALKDLDEIFKSSSLGNKKIAKRLAMKSSINLGILIHGVQTIFAKMSKRLLFCLPHTLAVVVYGSHLKHRFPYSGDNSSPVTVPGGSTTGASIFGSSAAPGDQTYGFLFRN